MTSKTGGSAPADTPTLIACESHAAIVIHLRFLTATGPHYSGGADSMTLCGSKPSWDLKCHPTEATCRTCIERSFQNV